MEDRMISTELVRRAIVTFVRSEKVKTTKSYVSTQLRLSCGSCGHELVSHCSYCPECGARLRDEDVVEL